MPRPTRSTSPATSSANTLLGNAGANVLDGSGGNDTLLGLGGADTFAFTTALGAGNVDTIVDFVAGTDKIALDDAVFTGLGRSARSPPAPSSPAPPRGDADDRIIYNTATGALFFDADGNGAGAAVQFATLTPGLGLAATDFTVGLARQGPRLARPLVQPDLRRCGRARGGVQTREQGFGHIPSP